MVTIYELCDRIKEEFTEKEYNLINNEKKIANKITNQKLNQEIKKYQNII